MTNALSPLQQKRQFAIKTLAMSALTDIEPLWQRLNLSIDYRIVKPAKVGMVMVRARSGTGGITYNQGEMTVTRCVVQDTSQRYLGVGYTQGRSLKKAELIAVVDLGLQEEHRCEQVMTELIEPLADKLQAQFATQQMQTQSTQVDFFTMMRGD